MKYTDHNKPQISLSQYLPDVYKSDINEVFSNMVIDRHFTKDDTTHINGNIGFYDTQLVNRQIQEDTPHRQAFQLAPTMYSKVGDSEQSLSFKHFRQQLELMGVDFNRLPNWANTTTFNFMPPINPDMIINYQDYFWDTIKSGMNPQYFVIENKCEKSQTRITAYENVVSQRGKSFLIQNVDVINNYFILPGNVTQEFKIGTTFYSKKTNNINIENKKWKVLSIQYDGTNDITLIRPTSVVGIRKPTAPLNPYVGQWWVKTNVTPNKVFEWTGTSWKLLTEADLLSVFATLNISASYDILYANYSTNSLIIQGDYHDIFVTDFLFFVKGGTRIVNTVLTTSNSIYDATNDITIIDVVEPLSTNNVIAPSNPQVGDIWYDPSVDEVHIFNGILWDLINNQIDSEISLSETLNLYRIKSARMCDMDLFDVGLFDDNNIDEILWNTNLLSSITNNNPPIVSGDVNPLWYNPTIDTLYQWGDLNQTDILHPDYTPTWNVIINNFSLILNITTGILTFDAIKNSGIKHQPTDWNIENHWIHKSNLTSMVGMKRAQVPILEYNASIELSEWSTTNFIWKYRKLSGQQFELIEESPTRLELEPIKNFKATILNNSWYIYLFNKNTSMEVDMDLTSIFVPGFKFAITNHSSNPSALTHDVYTVDTSEFRMMTTSDPIEVQGPYMVTVIRLQEMSYNSTLDGTNNNCIIPYTTSQGDSWKGYHIHWCLSENLTQTTLQTSKMLNVHKILDITPTIVNIHQSGYYNSFIPKISSLILGSYYQEFVVDIDNITRIDIDNRFKYNKHVSRLFAKPNTNDLRVYINNIRQIGNYVEHETSITPLSTIVHDNGGSVIQTVSTPIHFIDYIEFPNNFINIGDIVRLEFGSSSYDDMGMTNVPIRTIENDDTFYNKVSLGTQPIYKSLVKNILLEQTKYESNQLPKFNVYNIVSQNIYTSNSIFKFRESEDADLDYNTLHRIVKSNNGTEFEFEQMLLDFDNSKIYSYRNINNIPRNIFWYNPNTNIVQYWDGFCWSTKILLSTPNPRIRDIFVSSVQPTHITDIDGHLWFNTQTLKLYNMTPSNNPSNWQEIDVLIQEMDPTFNTIWKSGSAVQTYIPKYVDDKRNPISIGDPQGDWELLEQWYLNPEHKNKQYINFSGLYPHFKSIIDHQQGIAGLPNRGIQAYVQDEYEFGLGGTIKEFNDSFDTLISAVNVDNVTPIQVIEFAQRQYQYSLQLLKDILFYEVFDVFSNNTNNNINSLTNDIVKRVLSIFEQNDNNSKIFNDTTAFKNGVGVRNMIATAAILGLADRTQPSYKIYNNEILLKHHDGHISHNTLSTQELHGFIRTFSMLTNSSGMSICRRGNGSYPITSTDFVNIYGNLTNGLYWINNTTQEISRFEVFQISPFHPSWYYNGQELPKGTKYYNTIDMLVYERGDVNWIPVNGIVGDISSLWVEIDMLSILGNILFTFENNLYEVSKLYDDKLFDYSMLTDNSDDLYTYNKLYQEQFDDYVVKNNVTLPLINTQYIANDPWTYNYMSSIVDFPPSIGNFEMASHWEALYKNWYGTSYPNLEPWILQGYTIKPDWWDEEYLETNGTRRWKYDYTTNTGMWNNIITGNVLGHTPPISGIKTYTYFSVNIDNVSINGIEPDGLFPPYYNTTNINNRSLISTYSNVVAPEADYYFGSKGPTEWNWLISLTHAYDNMIIAFKMQPIKFFHYAFGLKYVNVGLLNVERTFERVFNHNMTLFHGDVYDTNNIFITNGLNQWYVNFNRYTSIDTNMRFISMWRDWSPKLTYQTDGIIDTNTLDITHKNYDITTSDFSSLLTINGIIDDIWIDAFNVKLVNIPPSIAKFNNQSLWKFEIDTMANISRTIPYYGVRSYSFMVDPTTNICTLGRYKIHAVNSNRLYVAGDCVDVFIYDSILHITDNIGNVSDASVLASVYDPTIDQTRITINIPVTSYMNGGSVDITSISFPWNTGDIVTFQSTKLLPHPLEQHTPYYIIKDNSMLPLEFKVAETFNDSLANIEINFGALTYGLGDLTVLQVDKSFNVLGSYSSTEAWYHITLDKSRILYKTFPTTIVGMQSLINIIDGISEIQQETIIIDSSTCSFDNIYGRRLDWQLELERFIDWAYKIRNIKLDIPNRYQISAKINSNLIKFIDNVPDWVNGKRVSFLSFGTLPNPLKNQTPYYIFKTDVVDEFIVSSSSVERDTTSHINFTNIGIGIIYISEYTRSVNLPTFEINPYRDNIVITTPTGVLANVIEGPFTDIRVKHALYDQYSRAITNDKLLTYRFDTQSKLVMVPEVPNDVETGYVNDPYHYIHFGGGHLFINDYEHFILFNDYTLDGNLLYDSFLGLNVSKLNIDLFRREEKTKRPTLGGHYMLGSEFYRNMEGLVQDLTDVYDNTTKYHNSDLTVRARDLIGYTGSSNYLDLLNIDNQSQFQFYKGMIANKGSNNSLQAFIQSKHFVSAEVDEYWAYKVAEFGDNRVKTYPEVKLFSTDSVIDDVRLMFLNPTGYDSINYTQLVNESKTAGFNVITKNDITRWKKYYEQMSELDSVMFLNVQVSDITTIFVSSVQPPLSQIKSIDYWLDISSATYTLNVVKDSKWVKTSDHKFLQTQDNPSNIYWKHDKICDDIRISTEHIEHTTLTINQDNNIPGITFIGGRYLKFVGNHTSYLHVGGYLNDTSLIQTVNFDGTNTIVHCNNSILGNNITIDSIINNIGISGNQVILAGDHEFYLKDKNLYVDNIVSTRIVSADYDGTNTIVTCSRVLYNTDPIYTGDFIPYATQFKVLNISLPNSIFDSSVGGSIFKIMGNQIQYLSIGLRVNNSNTFITNLEFDGTYTIISISDNIVGTGITFELLDFSKTNNQMLIEGLNYVKLNSESVELLFEREGTNTLRDHMLLTIFSLNPSKMINDPIKLVDDSSNFVVEKIPMWHPALGYHNYIADHNITLYNDIDPAFYTNSINPLNISDRKWGVEEVGTIWTDTSYLGYVPYSDDKIFPDIEVQLKNWGKLAEYGKAKVYRWTISPVEPSSWEQYVLSQGHDSSISSNTKASGIAKTEYFVNKRKTYDGIIIFSGENSNTQFKLPDIIDLEESDQIVFNINSYIPNEFEQEFPTYVTNLDSTGTLFNLVGYQDDSIINAAILTFDVDVIIRAIRPLDINQIPIFNPDGTPNDTKQYSLVVNQNSVLVGDVIEFKTSTGILPTGIKLSTSYRVNTIVEEENNKNIIMISEIVNGIPLSNDVIITELPTTNVNDDSGLEIYTGVMQLVVLTRNIKMAPSFKTKNWVKIPFVRYHSPFRLLTNELTKDDSGNYKPSSFNWINLSTDPTWHSSELVNIYKNGILWESSKTLNVSTTDISVQINKPLIANEIIDIYVNDQLVRSDVSPNVPNYITLTGSVLDNVIEIRVHYHHLTVETLTTVPADINVISAQVNIEVSGVYSNNDIIDIVRSYDNLDLTFDPSVYDDGDTTVWWKQDFEYSLINMTDKLDNLVTYFCFWVEQSNIINDGNNQIPVNQIATNLVSNTNPYYITKYLTEINEINPLVLDRTSLKYNNIPYDILMGNLPMSYRRLIVRNISDYVKDNNNYLLRFTKDLTLRDNIKSNGLNNNLKNVHEEWMLFRKQQPINIDKLLWDKMVDGLSGDKLSRERVLYDAQFGTDTRFGLGPNQVFVDSVMGLTTVLTYLTDPTIDFNPVQIDQFLLKYSFDTPDNIREAMEEMYYTFGYQHINNIWFNVLHDALATKKTHPELMKTSWISLKGVLMLEVNGMFNE